MTIHIVLYIIPNQPALGKQDLSILTSGVNPL